MRAVRYDRPEEFGVIEAPDLRPQSGEVVLRIVRSGVCGTDVHLHHGNFSPRYPLIPGHESVGVVDQLGESVTSLQVGDLVAVNNRVECGGCRNCRRGMPAFCLALADHGVTEPGGCATRLVMPAAKCHPAGDLTADQLAFAEPAACALHGVDIARPRPGSNILIFGAGTTGLLLAQALRASGAAQVTIAAPTQHKLDLAHDFGIDNTVRIDRTDSAAAVSSLRDRTDDGFDLVVDATGALSVLQESLALVRNGGTLLIYGLTGEEQELPIRPYEIFSRELTIKGSFTQAYSFDRGLAMLRSGAIRTEGMITHRFGLDEYQQALDAVDHDRSCIKAVIEPQ
ncbi:zinc-dependent alcohol dehydrogenase family protein [Microlunatus soli]|uniref:D-arabinitol dehydrogenase (NADP+) n=1 Tax=Microlunatus soli TaxID=630515 RepID=A0A1H1PXG6_9ACTN|nr:zinc-dependent alcohol dehydrogenase family protein [Microlunatus soli]SDS15806.1 D-arabinitol dehydrogenase (NADP+) [Microlunatus soli]